MHRTAYTISWNTARELLDAADDLDAMAREERADYNLATAAYYGEQARKFRALAMAKADEGWKEYNK